MFKDRKPRQVDPITYRAVMKAWKSTCQYCLERSATCLDHIHPFSKGGETEIENLIPACKPCNQRKAAKEFPLQTTLFFQALVADKKRDVELLVEKEKNASKKSKKHKVANRIKNKKAPTNYSLEWELSESLTKEDVLLLSDLYSLEENRLDLGSQSLNITHLNSEDIFLKHGLNVEKFSKFLIEKGSVCFRSSLGCSGRLFSSCSITRSKINEEFKAEAQFSMVAKALFDAVCTDSISDKKVVSVTKEEARKINQFLEAHQDHSVRL